MNSFEINPEEETPELIAFRDEIRALKEEESREGVSAHLTELNPDNLTEIDQLWWSQYKIGTLDPEELQEAIMNTPMSDSKIFLAYIANRIGSFAGKSKANEAA